MSKTKNNSTVFKSFGGIDLTSERGSGLSARSIVNFRVLSNGALEKRQGFRFLADIGSGTVRALYGNTVNGKYTLFVLLDSNAYAVDADTGARTLLGSVSTSSGNACFFFFRETLYLLDGRTVYEYIDGAFKETVGYVPLVAKNWVNDLLGEPCEPRNILNRHARATYVISETPSVFLCVGEPVASVEAVYVNHALQSADSYSFSNVFNTVNVKGLAAGDKVEIYFTYLNGYDELLSRLCSSTSAALFGGIGSNRLFLCGGNGTGTVFSTRNVSSLDTYLSQKHYPDSNSLYFPVSYEFDAGDGINGVQTIVRQYGHILIFTEGDVWMISPDDDGSDYADATSVSSRIGCPVEHGATLTDKEPVSVGTRSVYAWQTGSGSAFNAINISAPIDSALGEEWLKGCGIHFDPARSELWLYNGADTSTWVYNTVAKAWYRFDNVSADKIFDLDGSVAFIKNNKLFVFDEDCCCDVDASGNTFDITASYKSNEFDLGTDGGKNLCSVVLRADLGAEAVCLTVEGQNTAAVTATLSDGSNSACSIVKKRLPTGKFRYASLTLESSSGARQRIDGLTLNTR